VILTGYKNLEIIAPHAANRTRGWLQQYGGEVTDGLLFLQAEKLVIYWKKSIKANRIVGI